MAQEPKQIIDIPELNNEQGAAKLEFSTRKYSNGQIVSAAHIQYAKDGMLIFMMYSDFSKTSASHQRPRHSKDAGRPTR